MTGVVLRRVKFRPRDKHTQEERHVKMKAEIE